MKIKDMTMIAVSAALICIAGPMSIFIGPVPLSLASFAVYLAGTALGPKRGTAAVGVYLLIGLAGIPVFSGFSGGFQKLAGVTGGFLLGYLPCACLTGTGAVCMERNTAGKWILPVMMTAGTLAMYLLGMIWFMIQTGAPLGGALSACVIPFIPGDAIKITAASVLTVPIRRALRSHTV